MGTDTRDLITATLKERAETGQPIDAGLLASSASTRGRRARRRRQAFRVGSGVVGVAALVTAGAVVLSTAAVPTVVLPATPNRTAPASAAVVPSDGFGMPPAVGQPGALTRPELVGTDPKVLHFSVDGLLGEAQTVEWTSAQGLESVQLSGLGDKSFMVSAGQSKAAFGESAEESDPVDVTINGKPGTLASLKNGHRRAAAKDTYDRSVITWQPVAGLWARAFASGVSRDAAVQMAKAVQFDRATRCATPYSLTSIPAGMTVKQCTVGFTRKALHPGLKRASLWLENDKRHTWLEVQPAESRPGWKANMTIGDLPVLHAQGNWLFYEAPYAATLSGEGGQDKGPLSSDDAKTLIAGFKPHGVPDDPITW